MPSWLTASLAAANSMGRGITALPRRPYQDPLDIYGSDTNGYTGQGPLSPLDDVDQSRSPLPPPPPRLLGAPAMPPPPVETPAADAQSDNGQQLIAPSQPVPEMQLQTRPSPLPTRPGGGMQSTQFPQYGQPSRLPQDPYIQQLRDQVSNEPDLPKAPGTLRSILATIAGATAGGAAFAPLIAYGPKGMAQIGAYQRAQAQLPTRIRIEELAGEQQNRALMNQNRQDVLQENIRTHDEAALKDQMAAYTSRVNNISTNKGYKPAPGETVPKDYPTVQITHPLTGEIETWVTPTKSQQKAEEDKILHEHDKPLGDEITTVLGLPKGFTASEATFPHYVTAAASAWKEKTPNEWSVALDAANGDPREAMRLVAETAKAGKFAPVINVNTQAANDPTNIQSYVDQMRENPDVFHELPQALKTNVGKEWSKQTGLPTPVKVSTTVEQASRTTIEHVNRVKELLQDPDIQKAFGPIMGRIGTLEQSVGDTYYKTGAQQKKEQELRTRLKYLVAQETRALTGGRSAVQFIHEMETVSANPNMAMDRMQGALNGALESSLAQLEATDKQRFGGKSRKDIRGTGNSQKIKVRRKADGKKGSILPEDYDPAVYEKI